jgi:hypothetical protein
MNSWLFFSTDEIDSGKDCNFCLRRFLICGDEGHLENQGGSPVEEATG